jgi:hypothetical protein
MTKNESEIVILLINDFNMKSSVIIQEIHDYVDQADQRFLALVYSMVQAEKKNQTHSKIDPKAEMIRRAEASEKDIASGRTIRS